MTRRVIPAFWPSQILLYNRFVLTNQIQRRGLGACVDNILFCYSSILITEETHASLKVFWHICKHSRGAFHQAFCQWFSLTNFISYWNPCIWLAESKFVSENHWQNAWWNAPQISMKFLLQVAFDNTVKVLELKPFSLEIRNKNWTQIFSYFLCLVSVYVLYKRIVKFSIKHFHSLPSL